MIHEPPSRWAAILVFMCSGSLYIGWQLMLVVISLGKICLKADGGWEVTARMVHPAGADHAANGAANGAAAGAPSVAGAPAPSTPPPKRLPSPLASPLAAAFSPAGAKSPPHDAGTRGAPDAPLSWAWLPASLAAPAAAPPSGAVSARGAAPSGAGAPCASSVAKKELL